MRVLVELITSMCWPHLLSSRLDHLSVVHGRPCMEWMRCSETFLRSHERAANSPKFEKGHVPFCVGMESNILGEVISNPLIQHHRGIQSQGPGLLLLDPTFPLKFYFFIFIQSFRLTGRIWIF